MNNKITTQKWILSFIFSVIGGIIIYFLMIKMIFKPDWSDTFEFGKLVFENLSAKNLKIKAYLPLFLGILPLLVTLIIFIFHKDKEMEEYGSAHFAKEEDFPKMQINGEKGLMLGCLYKEKTPKQKILELIGKKQPDEIKTFIRCLYPLACLVVAPPGTGKTASIALPNLFSLINSCVVLDIKGELYQKSAGYRQKHFGHKILRFSPLSKDNTMFFNPFDNSVIKDLDFVEMKQLADQIAGTIFVGEKGKETDHWLVSAKTMFSFFAMYNMQKHKHATLGDLAQAPKKDYYGELEGEFFQECIEINEDTGEETRKQDVDTLKVFFKQVAADENLHDIVRNQARAYTTAANEEFASIKSTYDTYMAVFSNPRVANAVSKMSFSFYDLREEKISCYIVIQSEDIDTLAPLIRIFVETMFKKLMSGQENSDPNKFIYFIGDEFVRFGKMPYLLEAPALCRSYGLIPIYITQSYEQVKKYYGEDDLNILRSNVGYQVVFTMNSKKDAEELSQMIGKFTRKKLSRSQGNLDFVKANDSVSNEGYELVPAQDILNMPNTEILILVRGFVKNPIKAKVNYWFKNPQWQGADKIPILEISESKETNETQIQENLSEKSTAQNIKQEQKSQNENQEDIKKPDEDNKEISEKSQQKPKTQKEILGNDLNDFVKWLVYIRFEKELYGKDRIFYEYNYLESLEANSLKYFEMFYQQYKQYLNKKEEERKSA